MITKEAFFSQGFYAVLIVSSVVTVLISLVIS